MAFSVDDLHDLIQLLEAHPAWKQELRRILFTDQLIGLPERMQELADKLATLTEHVTALAAAQQRTEARLEELAAAQQRTEARLEELAAAQQRTEARLEELAAAQQRTEARLEELAAAQQQTEARLDALAEQVKALAVAQQQTAQQVGTLATRVDTLRGDVLEARFRDRAPAYLGSQGFRRTRVVPTREWVDRLDDALDAGRITDAERAELLLTDVVVQTRDTQGDVWLAVEVSATVDTHDVERAQRRATLLARLDGRARGAVAGHTFTALAEAALRADPSMVAVRILDN